MRTPPTLTLLFFGLGPACAGDKTVTCGTGTTNVGGTCEIITGTSSDTDTGADTDVDSDTDTGTDSGADTATDIADPSILLFSADRDAMQDGEGVSFSVIVTDPQGIADVIGGVLQTAGGSTYASFATSGDEGAYGISITWDDVVRLAEVADFTGSASDITFKAVFYDVEGHTAEATTTVGFECTTDDPDFCGDSACTDLDSDLSNCGSCDNDCATLDTVGGTDQTCEDGQCYHDTLICQTIDSTMTETGNDYCEPGTCRVIYEYDSSTCTGSYKAEDSCTGVFGNIARYDSAAAIKVACEHIPY